MFNSTSLSLIIGFFELVTLETEISLKMVNIAKILHVQRPYHTAFFMTHGYVDSTLNGLNGDLFLQLFQKKLEVPILNLKGNVSFNWLLHYNRELLAIMILNGCETQDKNRLKSLWMTLKGNRSTRTIVLAGASEMDEYLRIILRYCAENNANNVIAFKLSFNDLQSVYTPNIYPEFSMKSRRFQLESHFEFYKDHVKDLRGYPIRVALAKNSARAYILVGTKGNSIIGGYVGHFVTEFFQSRNATLVFPHMDEVHVTALHMNAQTIIDNYNISAEPINNVTSEEIHQSPPYLFLSCCLMAPTEKALPSYLFYVIIFDGTIAALMACTAVGFILSLALTYWIEDKTVASNAVLNIYIFNGLLGQSFRMEQDFRGLRSVLYILVSLAGVIFNTTYVTYLQTFNAHPPTEKPVRSVADIRKSGMQFATFQEEYNMLNAKEGFESFRDVAKIISFKQFYELRDNFNTRYLYPISSPSWALFEKQQSFFRKPRFFLSEICFFEQVALSVYLPLNSPFKEAIDASIGYVHQGGLEEHWMRQTFLEGVRMKRYIIRDISEESDFEPMKIQDLQLVMYIFLAMICVMIVCFLGELMWGPNLDSQKS